MGIPAPYGVAALRRPSSLAADPANAVITGTFSAVGPGKVFAFKGPVNLSIYATLTTTLTTTSGSNAATVASGTGIAAGGAVKGANVPLGTTWATFSGTAGTLALPSVDLQADFRSGIAQLRGLRTTPAWLVGSTVIADNIPANTTVLAITQQTVLDGNGTAITLGVVTLSAAPTADNFQFRQQPGWVTIQPSLNAIVTGSDTAAVMTGAGITYTGTVQVERSFDGGFTWTLVNTYSAGTPINTLINEPETDVYYRANCTAYTSGVINYRFSEVGAAGTSMSLGSPI